MKRTTKITTQRKASLIICSDIHLREDQPACRVDDFQEAQWRKMLFISKLSKTHECPVVHAGDLFHHWKPSPWLLSKTISHLPSRFYTVYGQHDLPQHNMSLKEKSGIYTLEMAEALQVLPEASWEQEPQEGSLLIPTDPNRRVLVWHKFNYKTTKPFPGATSRAVGLLKKYPQFDLIVTGDNHQAFTETYEDRVLVNPGSLTRQKSDQKDHKPCVFLYYAEDNSFEQVFLPIDKDAVIVPIDSQKQKQRNQHIEAFISKLNKDVDFGIDFEDNLKRYLHENTVKPEVEQIIKASVDYE